MTRASLALDGFMRSRIDLRGRGALCLVGCSALYGCAPDDLHASPDEIARAKQVYTQCVEDELGIEVEAIDIAANGDITVQFGEGYTAEGEARAISICEPRIRSVLEPGGVSVLGPPANLGQPGSDRDLEELLAERARLGFEGAIIAEYQGERRISKGFGELTPGSMRVPDAETAFDCGSIMKEVTAATIFVLEEAGALSREQTLGEFFEQAPSVWRSVTLDQVITHRAGFGEYHDTEGDFQEMDRATAMEAIFAQEPRFAPGTDHAYSNSGYSVLAAVIETVTGEDYRSAVRRRVFEPLGMSRSGFYGEPLWDDRNVAVGRGALVYAGNDPSRWPPPTWALMGNGGLVSTLDDLMALAKAFDDDRLFRTETREAFRREQVAGSIGGRPVIGYAGGNDFGFNALVGQVVGDSTYVVAASHALLPVTAEILGIEVLQVLYGDEIVLPERD